ncbi:MAG: YebC/PmpR family DNA-binding transcriptional regulator [Myxococcales bacterium]|jgi:YebC/PmpR family DNA-binding regulatory protein|nr:YebC/PmpR family DNA-binding transcriptional regulator [Myxococcales bacterium]MBL0194875.1 YebC/PmpR family DNA-binding transcriptional regulator [Myxococcales bacterium]
MSGHSKWATIKHKKGAADAKRGKLFTKLIKELTVAARMGGGDAGGNPRLRKAISDAKNQSMPGDTITRAVKRGTGELEGASYDEVLYEGTGPGGTLFLVEGMTDNRNRTVAELRKIFEKNNGVLGGAGAAAWAFERKGVITLDKPDATEDQLMEIAVGAGADDYADLEEEWHITTPPEVLSTINDALEAAGLKTKNASLAYLPKAKKPLTGRDAEVAMNLAEALDDHDDVQNVFADFDISDEELQSLA